LNHRPMAESQSLLSGRSGSARGQNPLNRSKMTLAALTNFRDHNPDPTECLFYRSFASPRFYTTKTHSGPQPSQNPALQRAPNALQNGTSLAVRPSARDAPSPAARRSCRISKGLHTATKIFRRYPQSGLTAPTGGIRSASSIGTVVRSSAVVVGQRLRKGRSMMGQARQCTCAEGQRTGRSIDRSEPCHGWLLMR
jgi:hypothetical protein